MSTAVRTWQSHDLPESLRSFELQAPFPADVTTPHVLVRPSECATYRFFDSHGALLYVGVSWNPFTRWGYHKRRAEWWSAASRVVVDVYSSDAAALRRERMWIAGPPKPLHNVRSAGR